MMRRIGIALGMLVVAGAVLGFAQPASAHPLGNFSVNQLAALDLRPDRIEVAVSVDFAELPTLQEHTLVDKDNSGATSDAELSTYANTVCTEFARDFAVTVDKARVAWEVSARPLVYVPGAAGLSTSRLSCTLIARTALGTSTVMVDNRFRADRIGWRELTATGDGVHIVDSPIPALSVSGGLTAYPADLLSSPLDVRSAKLRIQPGDGPKSTVDGAALVPSSGGFLTSWTAGAERTLRGWVGDRGLTPWIGALAVLLALVLGAAHAALPGHGKTVMAAYLAGRHGRPRDALAVGATVTITHTGGVLVLGLLLTTVAGLVGEAVLGWLGVVSGVLIAVLGASMLFGLLRRRAGSAHGHRHGLFGHSHSHGPRGHSHEDHDHGQSHSHGHSHSHGEHGHDHGHSHAHDDHDHSHAHDDHGHDGAHDDHDGAHDDHDHEPAARRRLSRLSIVSMGVAGGLVPSPSALIILLGAIGLGRTAFGVLLVIGYGLGMAATLTAAGLLLIKIQDRWSKRLPRLTARLSRFAPAGTAALVLLVGLGLASRALVTL